MMKTTLPMVFGASVFALSLGASDAVEFKKDILPIIEESCYKCHGDGAKKAGVNLDASQIENAIGDTIVPGDLEKSELYTSLLPGADEAMPPKGKAPKVSDSDIAKIKEWILAGAPLEGSGGSATADAGGSAFPARQAPLTDEFTNAEGVVITATLLRVDGETAILRMAGGKIYNYPIAKLSAESQAKVREFEKSSQDS
jgi:cytochrome c5